MKFIEVSLSTKLTAKISHLIWSPKSTKLIIQNCSTPEFI